MVSGDTVSVSAQEIYCLELWLVVSGDTVSVSVSVLAQENEGEEDTNEQEWELIKETSCGLQHFRSAASPL